MTNPPHKGQGAAIKWLRDHLHFSGDECLPWPFTRLKNGYGRFGYNAEHFYAHRYMCEMVHGPAPSPIHQASHSCGRGHDGCLNPRHISWKTPSGNQLDRRAHGTSKRCGRKLTPIQRRQIVALKGQKTQREIAVMFGITFQNVSHIHRVEARKAGVQCR